MDAIDGDSKPVEQQFIVGAPSSFLDASDWIWPGSWLAKLFLWDRKIDSHTISDETIGALAEYLQSNELDDVQVLVNTYRPGVQWSRTFRNQEVGAGWRYTLGILSATFYTILPGRFFGGDHYNPYSNTISIYSDIEGVALHEAGHAKDSNSRRYKGTYGAIYMIPGVPLYHEAVASNDALSYLHSRCDLAGEKAAYRILHPAYGTYVGGTFFSQSGAALLGAIPGHITGAIAAAGADPMEDCPTPGLDLESEQHIPDTAQN